MRILSCTAMITLMTVCPAMAQTSLPTLTVDGKAATSGSLTIPSNAMAKATIQQTAGGVAVVTDKDIANKYVLNFQDSLAYVAGVNAQQRYAEEVRLSIRGSGISRGFHLRGITLLQDGIPFTLADGGGDFQEADPLTFQRLEVYKGANALQYGSTTLGGAVNMVSKTGRSQTGSQARVEVGSFETLRLNAQDGRVYDNADSFISVTGLKRNGFRQHEDTESLKLNTNTGLQLNDNLETRFYLSGNVIEQDLAGTITREAALKTPERAAAGAIANDIARDIRSVRLGNKTTYQLGDITLNGGAYVAYKDLFHPLTFGVIDQTSINYGVFGDVSGNYQLAGYRNLYRVGMTTQFGETDAKTFTTNGGSRGNLTSQVDQSASNVVGFAENTFYVLPELGIITAGQLLWAERIGSSPLNANLNGGRTYRAFNPKLGVLYDATPDMQLFANISKSYEPATFSELFQGIPTSLVATLKPQEAWTAEIGTRGSYGRFAFDVSLFRSWVKNELLQFDVAFGLPNTINAQRTIHQGAELGLSVALADGWTWQHAYTYSDFRFQGDAAFGNNRLAGIPVHYYQGEVRYSHADGWYIAPNVEWVPMAAFVDFANTTKSTSYVALGASAGYTVNERVNVFVEGRNLTDASYINTFSTVATATPASAVYYPAAPRSVYAGVTVRF